MRFDDEQVKANNERAREFAEKFCQPAVDAKQRLLHDLHEALSDPGVKGRGGVWLSVEQVKVLVSGNPRSDPIQPTYYLRHPDETYTVADPQPVTRAALDAKVKEANELIVRYQETIQRLQSELDNAKVVIEEQAFELGRLRNRVTVMGIGSLRHREVMGDECAIEGCPYEHDGDSSYCAEHQDPKFTIERRFDLEELADDSTSAS